MLDSMKTSQNGNKNKKRVLTGYMKEKLAVTFIVITLALIALVVVLYNLIKEKEYEYTQVWGENSYTIKSDGKTAEIFVNGEKKFTENTGVRIVTDKQGNFIRKVIIEE